VQAPLLTYVTDTATVPEHVLLERLGTLAARAPTVMPRVAVQLRDPFRATRDLLLLAKRLRAHADELGYRLLVNDRIDVAILARADGVHLGRASMCAADARRLLGPDAFVSIACHDTADVLAAARAGADACTLSPVFASPGKGPPLGTEAIVAAKRALADAGLAIAVVALGGIDASSALLAFDAGADGVASIRAEVPASSLRP
jgi:thiamine-phosphate pyrophosphorylase